MRQAFLSAHAGAPHAQEFTEENFRGLRDWATIFTELKAKNIKTITPEQAAAAVASRRVRGGDAWWRCRCICARCARMPPCRMLRRRCACCAQAPGPLDAVLGAPTVLLDVREERYFRSARPEGADNVPLYKPLVCAQAADASTCHCCRCERTHRMVLPCF